MTALVVHSGGLDSTVALCWAAKEYGNVEAISFLYGQRHNVEINNAKDICDYLGVTHIVQHIELAKAGVLMVPDEMPHMTYEELAEAQGPSPTYVPYRNGTFLSLSASFALVRGCDIIVAGMHAEDARNWAYPDCTPEFIGAMQNAIYVGTYQQVRLVCPWTYMTKAQIIQKGIDLGAPLHMTMSCYEGRDPACGKCPTCVARLEAFKSIGVSDPLEYEFDSYRTGISPAAVVASLELMHGMEVEEEESE